MNENASSARETLERIVKKSGITKKLAAEILHAIPGIIEEGLKKDGEVRVKGLGTFRLRWTRGRLGRNPKTGERVEIPAHNRVVFIPEQAFKEYINRDFRLLGYKIIPPAEQGPAFSEIIAIQQPEAKPEPEHFKPSVEQEPEPVQQVQPLYQPEAELETEPLAPIRKRRIHWIVPVAIGVIIILSGLFYLRNFHTSQRSAVSSQKIEVDSRQLTVDSSQQAIEPNQQSEIRNPKSELKTQPLTLKTIPSGTRLFKLAREIYGNPYLWVLIYKENLDKIPDPDMLISGRELVIPVLEGSPKRLTRNDSLAVSEGYRLVYEYFKTKDDPRANDFSRAMKRYMPK
jgi:nucleoid DNA-binding protein